MRNEHEEDGILTFLDSIGLTCPMKGHQEAKLTRLAELRALS